MHARRRKEERTEIIEAMIGHVGSAIKGQLDPRGAKELLIGILVAGGFFTALSVEPAILAGALGLANAFKKEDKASVKKVKASFQYARKRGYVTVEEVGDEVIVRMTQIGMIFAKRHTLRFLPRTIDRTSEWDKHWRIIMFDIPANERNLRDAFRTLIKRIGARQLQKSVWVYPFECADQINFFKTFFKLGDAELRLITTSSIGNDEKLRAHFKL